MKKLFILIIVVAMVLSGCGGTVQPVEQSRSSISSSNSDTTPSKSSNGINLSETYTNEDEGISFKYPSGWKLIHGDSLTEYYDDLEKGNVVAFLANEEGDPEGYSYIEICRWQRYQNEINKVFSATESDFEMTIDGEDVMVAILADITLDGIPVRMLIYTSDGVYVRRFYYAIDDTMYKIDFICQTRQAEALEPFFIAISESYRITKDNTASISYDGTEESAQMLLKAWLVKNPLSDGELRLQDTGTQTIGGRDYHQFGVYYDDEALQVALLVDKETGALAMLDWVNEAALPLDEWYQETMNKDSTIESSDMITEDGALEIISNIVGNNYYIDLDREEGNAYVIHVYQISGSGTDTLDWFYVDKSTGAVEASFGYFDSVG